MLIHTCCADCFLKFYQTLNKKQKANLQIYFYNPNIYPREEYQARLLAVKKVVKSLKEEIKISVANYQPQKYFQSLNNLRNMRENRENKIDDNYFTIISQQQRCPICWELRLRALFEKAKLDSIPMVSSTLFSSNYQDLSKIKVIAKKLSDEYHINFYFPNIIKAERDQTNRGFYKQNYCGCLYSLIEKSREKYQNSALAIDCE